MAISFPAAAENDSDEGPAKGPGKIRLLLETDRDRGRQATFSQHNNKFPGPDRL